MSDAAVVNGNKSVSLPGKRRDYSSLIAFCLPCVILLCLFVVRKIAPFGALTLLQENILSEVSPLMEALRQGFLSRNLFYTHKMGLGTNLWTTFSYYGMSPLHFLAMPFFPGRANEGVLLLLLLRTGLSGLFMYRLMKKKDGLRGWFGLMLSLLYALGSNVFFFYQDVFGGDFFFLLPLVCSEFLVLLSGKRTWTFSLALFLFGISSIPSLWTFLLLSPALLHFLYLSWKRKQLEAGEPVRPVFNQICVQFFVGLFAAAVFWLPVLYSLILQGFPPIIGNLPAFDGLSYSFFDFLKNALFPMSKEAGSVPFLITGGLLFILIPLYVLHRGISFAEKLYTGGLAVFLYFSLQFPIVNRFLNLFSPDSGNGSRQSIVLVFLLVCAVSAVLRDRKKISKGQVIGAGMAVLAFSLLVRQDDKKTASDWTAVVLWAIVLLLTLFLYLWQKKAWGESETWKGLLLLILVYEMMVLGDASLQYLRDTRQLLLGGSPTPYRAEIAEMNALQPQYERMVLTPVISGNDGILYDGNTLSITSDFVSKSYLHLAKGLGLWTDGVSGVQSAGLNRASGLLLGIRSQIVLNRSYVSSEGAEDFAAGIDGFRVGYPEFGAEEIAGVAAPVDMVAESWMVSGPPQYTDLGFMMWGVGAYQAENRRVEDAFSPGLFVPDAAVTDRADAVLRGKQNVSPFVYTNALYAEWGLPLPYVEGTVDIVSGANMKTTSAYEFSMEMIGTDTVFTFSAKPNSYEGEVFIYIDSRQEMSLTLPPLSEDQAERTVEMGGGRLLSLGILSEGTQVTVKGKIPNVRQEKVSFYVGTLIPQNLDQAAALAHSRGVEFSAFEDTFIRGTVSAGEDGRVYFSVPQDYGWKVKVDGKKAILDRSGPFLFVSVAAGTHTIELSYLVPGFLPGILLSFFSILSIFVLEKRREEESEDAELSEKNSEQQVGNADRPDEDNSWTI